MSFPDDNSSKSNTSSNTIYVQKRAIDEPNEEVLSDVRLRSKESHRRRGHEKTQKSSRKMNRKQCLLPTVPSFVRKLLAVQNACHL